jgi:hypothetical protein
MSQPMTQRQREQAEKQMNDTVHQQHTTTSQPTKQQQQRGAAAQHIMP